MKKRASEVLRNEIVGLLKSNTERAVKASLHKLAALADILDQSGHHKTADKLEALMKEAGFWSAFFAGLSGGGGAGIWDALKQGRLKDSITEIVKKALIGGATAVVVEYLIKGLDEIPLVGPFLKELGEADKIRTLLEGIVGSAVAESDLANKLVDKTIAAIEGYLGMTKEQGQAEVPGVMQQTQKPSTQPLPGVVPKAGG